MVATADKRTGLEHLDEATCWQLLENETVGRLGFNPDHTDPGFGD